MVAKFLIKFLFLICAVQAWATEFSQMHTHSVRALLVRLGKGELPRIEVCLRHQLSGDCLPGRENNFFTCDSPRIADYISCISDPNLNRRIAQAYTQMHSAALREIRELEQDSSTSQAEKQRLLPRMRAAVSDYEQMATSPEAVMAQIDRALNAMNRFHVAEILRSPEFQTQINTICQNHPNACMSVRDYYSHGRQLLQQFNQRFSSGDREYQESFGQGLEDALRVEVELAMTCLNEPEQEFCESFQVDPSLVNAVTQEIETGICDHRVTAAKMSREIQRRFQLVCDEMFPYLRYAAAQQDQQADPTPDEEEANYGPQPADAQQGPPAPPTGGQGSNGSSSERREGASPEGSRQGWEGGEAGGKNVNRTGIYLDWGTEDLEEDVYTCARVDTAVQPDCDRTAETIPVSEATTDLARAAEQAAQECSQEVNAYHRAQMDAASYMLETQMRAYIDRLNFDPTLSAQSYQEHINALKNSCQIPAQTEGECNYQNVLRTKTREYVDSITNQALAQRRRVGFGNQLSEQYLQDSVKAAQDLAEIDSTLRGLLANFPEPQQSWKEIWPEMFPCQSVVGIMDEIRTIWNRSHYDTRCAPIEVSESENIFQSEEELYQYFRSVELGLVEGVTLDTLPNDPQTQNRLATYRQMRSSREFANDLDQVDPENPVQLSTMHSSMFYGTSSDTGRLLIPPGTLTGLESRKLECKKKAQQVKKLMNMKLSILSNYPQLANKTFSNGVQPTAQWQFWDSNCRGHRRHQTICAGPERASCETIIRPGCEREPSDWGTQERPKNLYEQLGENSDDYDDMIARQFSVDQAQNDLNSLKTAVGSICRDPLEAGAEVLKDDRLYTLYASCALQNVQNGERRVADDRDQYAFWSDINNSADARARCARRSGESYDRCRIVRHLESGLGNMLARGAATVASPLVNTLDFAGCIAMFTGIGGAIYSGVRAGATAGVGAGVRAGARYLGGEMLAAGRSLATPLGAGLTVGGVGLTYHYAEVAEREYEQIQAQHAAGLASEEQVQRARRAYEQTRMSNNLPTILQTILVGAFIPGGGGGHTGAATRSLPTGIPDFPQATISRRVSAVDDVSIPLASADLEFLPPRGAVDDGTISLRTREIDYIDNPPTPAPRARGDADATVDHGRARARAQDPDPDGTVNHRPRRSDPTDGDVDPNATKPSGPRRSRGDVSPNDEVDISLSFQSSVRHFDDNIQVRQLGSDGEVVANFGNCCSGQWAAQQRHIDEQLDLAMSVSERNPYFIGQFRRTDGSQVRAQRVDGYSYVPPASPLRLDFSREFPGLGDFRVRTFELDARGKLTPASREEALAYINRNYPGAENYNIEYLAQGGFNAVFKACPRSGGGRCKVIKLPGMDQGPVNQVNTLEGQLRDLDSQIEAARGRLLDSNLSADQARDAYEEFNRLNAQRNDLSSQLQRARDNITNILDNYKMDLGLIAWADQLLASGRGPRLNGREFLAHGTIDRNPELISRGIVVQDYYGLNAPEGMTTHTQAMRDSAGSIAEGSPDHAIITRFSEPSALDADMRTLMEFSSLCNSAQSAAVRSYCSSMRSANNLPEHQELTRMTQATMQFFEDTHSLVGRAVFANFGRGRGNPTHVANPVVRDGVIVDGTVEYSTVGFDPLGGRNVFFDTQTGRVVLPDR